MGNDTASLTTVRFVIRTSQFLQLLIIAFTQLMQYRIHDPLRDSYYVLVCRFRGVPQEAEPFDGLYHSEGHCIIELLVIQLQSHTFADEIHAGKAVRFPLERLACGSFWKKRLEIIVRLRLQGAIKINKIVTLCEVIFRCNGRATSKMRSQKVLPRIQYNANIFLIRT